MAPPGCWGRTESAASRWARGSLLVERFTPIERGDDEVDLEFEVELAGGGAVLTVPSDRSILDVVSDAGIQVLSSCTEGTCGTCETRVISGQIDHRESVLSQEEQDDGDIMMICVSRACGGRLVLDL